MKYTAAIILIMISLICNGQSHFLKITFKNIDNGTKLIIYYPSHELDVNIDMEKEKLITLNNLNEPFRLSLSLSNNTSIIQDVYLTKDTTRMIINKYVNEIDFIEDTINRTFTKLAFITRDVIKKENEIYDSLDIIDSTNSKYTQLLNKIKNLNDSLLDYRINIIKQNQTQYLSLILLQDLIIESDSCINDKLLKLFNTLNMSLHKYKAYKRCELILNKPCQTYKIGDIVNNYTFYSKDTIVKLSDLLNKQLLYINFWGTRCNFAIKSHTALKSIESKYNDNITIISISNDEDSLEYNKYLQLNQIDWINICDFEGWLSPNFLAFGINGIPRDIIVNKSGVILYKNIHSWEAYEILSKLIN